MSTIVYRELALHEAPLLRTIDRYERIGAIYRVANGMLELEAKHEDVLSWDGTELETCIARLELVVASRGRAFAAWDEEKLVGIGSLDTSGVGGESTMMKLDLLYVSAAYRGGGIGRKLTELLASEAKALGATSLYVSATPTQGTVDAYLCMGAELLEAPDGELLALEPDDVHLRLSLDT